MATKTKRTKGQKFGTFVKQHVYFISLGMLILALSVGIGVMAIIQSMGRDTDVPIVVPPLTASLPMANAQVRKSFSDTELQRNNYMGWYEVFKGVMLQSSTSNDVMAILPGTVASISADSLTGTKIVIEHDGGYRSISKSLASNVSVVEGDRVVQGQKIGTASNSAGNKAGYGTHLQFQLFRNGQVINPASVLDLDNK